MSTDDLVRRARLRARSSSSSPLDKGLVSELADEVDRLRAERLDLIASRAEFQRAADRRTAERDAARAALERVRLITDRVAGVDSELAHRATVVENLRHAALEGEAS